MSAHDGDRLSDETLIQWIILVIVFDGDPCRWLDYLETEGSPSQRREDLLFVRELVTQWLLHGEARDDDNHPGDTPHRCSLPGAAFRRSYTASKGLVEEHEEKDE